jgi:hypothetical protein
MSHDLHQMMLVEPVKRLQIVTAEFADDLGSILRWRKTIVLRLGPVLDIFELKIHRAGVQSRFVCFI